MEFDAGGDAATSDMMDAAMATDGGSMEPSAWLQIIHNSQDPALATLDVWLGDLLVLDDLHAGQGTGLFAVSAREPLQITVTGAQAAGPDEDPLAVVALPAEVLVEGARVAVVAMGTDDVQVPFNEQFALRWALLPPPAASPEALTLALIHGAPGVPSATSLTLFGAPQPAASGLRFGNWWLRGGDQQAGGLVIEERPFEDRLVVGLLEADARPVGSFQTNARGLVTGVLIDVPEGSSTDLALRLYPASVMEEPQPQAGVTLDAASRVQLIHNIIGLGEATFTVAGAELAGMALGFRQATSFVTLPSGAMRSLVISPSGGNAMPFMLPDLQPGARHVVVLDGVDGDMTTPPMVAVLDAARERARDEDNVDVVVHHGIPDASSITIDALGITGLGYGEFGPTAGDDSYVNRPGRLLEATLEIPDASVAQIYGLEFDLLAGLPLVAVASGLIADGSLRLVLFGPGGGNGFVVAPSN